LGCVVKVLRRMLEACLDGLVGSPVGAASVSLPRDAVIGGRGGMSWQLVDRGPVAQLVRAHA
jgi:hypothetical protein